jgi:hypothetical protein
MRVRSCVLTLVIGCASESSGPVTASQASLEVGGRRELDPRAAWSATGATTDPGACFGATVAVGDLDGDGHVELVVGEPPCAFNFEPVPGRIGIFRGTCDGRFEDEPVWTELAWTNQPSRMGAQQTLAIADVDGDGGRDIVVGARAGVQVFTAISDVTVPLGAPSHRVPGSGVFGPASVGDLDGDHRAEIISVRANVATVWRAAAGGAMTSGRTFTPASAATPTLQWDDDGDADLLVRSGESTTLFRGCAPLDADCDGGLENAPAWSFGAAVLAIISDLDGDGLGEALVSGGTSRVFLHLSDPVTGISEAVAWSTIGDPNYPALGARVLVPGDLDGDRTSTEFLLASAGRTYAFFPRRRHLADLEPGFAWPRSDSAQRQLLAGEATFGSGLSSLAAARIDGDRAVDLVIGSAPEFDSVLGEFAQTRAGTVALFPGGKVPSDRRTPPPFLPEARTCDLPSGGKPDLFVDPAPIARSLFVERREFAADACEVAEECVGGPGNRKLLRFSTAIANVGGAALVIPGPETAPELYHFDECHGHDHLENFARYDLLDANGAVVTTGRKQGFFMVDVAPLCSNGEDNDYFPDQGVSPGWSDIYVSSLPCQWIDITDVRDGVYTLEVAADTNHLVDQDDVQPDVARVRVRLANDRVTVLP